MTDAYFENIVAPESFDPVTEDDITFIRETAANREYERWVIVGSIQAHITHDSIRSLLNVKLAGRVQGWLDDEGVNGYLSLLRERSILREAEYDARDEDARLPRPVRTFVINSNFSTMLASTNMDRTDTASVLKHCRRYHRKLDFDIRDTEACKLFYPIHDANHWMLFVADMDRGTFELYDPTGEGEVYNERADQLERALNLYFKELLEEEEGEEVPEFDEWVTKTSTTYPTQEDSISCGVFTCMYAHFLSLHHNLETLTRETFNQSHISYFRMHILMSVTGHITL